MATSVLNPGTGIMSWDIDPVHSSVQFSVRHMMISNVRGEFKISKGSVRFDQKSPDNVSVVATIDATSINTREAERDRHIKSADFLDTEHFPEILFVSKKVEVTPQGKYKVLGDLTIRGMTKEVVVLAEAPSPAIKDPWGAFRHGTSATARINRRDFGLKWNEMLETGGVLVGDEVSINIDAQFVEN